MPRRPARLTLAFFADALTPLLAVGAPGSVVLLAGATDDIDITLASITIANLIGSASFAADLPPLLNGDVGPYSLTVSNNIAALVLPTGASDAVARTVSAFVWAADTMSVVRRLSGEEVATATVVLVTRLPQAAVFVTLGVTPAQAAFLDDKYVMPVPAGVGNLDFGITISMSTDMALAESGTGCDVSVHLTLLSPDLGISSPVNDPCRIVISMYARPASGDTVVAVTISGDGDGALQQPRLTTRFSVRFVSLDIDALYPEQITVTARAPQHQVVATLVGYLGLTMGFSIHPGGAAPYIFLRRLGDGIGNGLISAELLVSANAPPNDATPPVRTYTLAITGTYDKVAEEGGRFRPTMRLFSMTVEYVDAGDDSAASPSVVVVGTAHQQPEIGVSVAVATLALRGGLGAVRFSLGEPSDDGYTLSASVLLVSLAEPTTLTATVIGIDEHLETDDATLALTITVLAPLRATLTPLTVTTRITPGDALAFAGRLSLFGGAPTVSVVGGILLGGDNLLFVENDSGILTWSGRAARAQSGTVAQDGITLRDGSNPPRESVYAGVSIVYVHPPSVFMTLRALQTAIVAGKTMKVAVGEFARTRLEYRISVLSIGGVSATASTDGGVILSVRGFERGLITIGIIGDDNHPESANATARFTLLIGDVLRVGLPRPLVNAPHTITSRSADVNVLLAPSLAVFGGDIPYRFWRVDGSPPLAISVYANGSVVYETPPPPFSLTLTVAAAANISGSDTLATATARFTLAAVPPPQMTLTVQHFDGVQLTGTSAFATLHIGGGFNNAGNDYRVTADGVSISLAGSVLVLSVVAIEAQTIIATISIDDEHPDTPPISLFLTVTAAALPAVVGMRDFGITIGESGRVLDKFSPSGGSAPYNWTLAVSGDIASDERPPLFVLSSSGELSVRVLDWNDLLGNLGALTQHLSVIVGGGGYAATAAVSAFVVLPPISAFVSVIAPITSFVLATAQLNAAGGADALRASPGFSALPGFDFSVSGGNGALLSIVQVSDDDDYGMAFLLSITGAITATVIADDRYDDNRVPPRMATAFITLTAAALPPFSLQVPGDLLLTTETTPAPVLLMASVIGGAPPFAFSVSYLPLARTHPYTTSFGGSVAVLRLNAGQSPGRVWMI